MLLKMVEEPPEKTLFLFITHAPEKVLQTIFSRCQSVRVLPFSKEELERTLTEKLGVDGADAASAAAFAGGSVGVAMDMILFLRCLPLL